MTTYDICILGGGIAGLYCAREIAKKWPDSKIAILEKYKILGGRMHTYHKDVPGVGEVRWENGAGRIHKSHALNSLWHCRCHSHSNGPTPIVNH